MGLWDLSDRVAAWPAGFAVAAALLGGWAALLVLAIPLRPRDYRVVVLLKPTHFIPAAVQLVLFVYWALYWAEVREHLAYVAAQLAFAYAFDLLLGLTLRRRWLLSFGPMPVVLSANLFVWYPEGHTWLALVLIALALGSKALLRWGEGSSRAGRHIFNPSAFGIACLGLGWLVAPELLPYFDIAHPLNAPPNMLELIFLLALIPQARVPIVLVSLGALSTMVVATAPGPPIRPGPMWAPVFLVLVLLATDPATIPRTGPGRLLTGVLVGLVIVVLSTTFEALGRSDFYAKVMAIPVANLLVVPCERFGDRLLSRWADLLSPDHNRRHMAAWVGLVLLLALVGDRKEGSFEAQHHEEHPTPHIVRRASGSPDCGDNPVFCSAFSFVGEAGLWARGTPSLPLPELRSP